MYEEIFDRLRAEAQARGIHATIYSDHAEERGGWLYIPVYISDEDGKYDAYDKVSLLQDMEDSWNDQEPKPSPRVFLRPAARPTETTGPSMAAGPAKT
jgi:hypothetical protein